MSTKPRILLLMPTKSYRAKAFLRAAQTLPLKITIGSEKKQALEPLTPGTTLTLDFSNPDTAVADTYAFAKEYPLAAILPTDDDTILLATLAAQALGLPHNSVQAARAVTGKHVLRDLLQKNGLPSPEFQVVETSCDPEALAPELIYPCIVKPLCLSGSRGVIKAENPDEFIQAFRRVCSILEKPEVRQRNPQLSRKILLEAFIPGDEVAFEGLLTDGALRTLAIFDKPDPLDGPYFEETIYVTPSRHSRSVQQAIFNCIQQACRAIGLHSGPVHAELRLNERGVWIIEIANRSIGGYCSQALRFDPDISLEELILRHALGQDVANIPREPQASGVMMIPIPQKGILKGVRGIEKAKMLPGVEDVIISIAISQQVVPLPEGHRYLGFIFARASEPQQVEETLRRAHDKLTILIE